jgi:hypothetical protein
MSANKSSQRNVLDGGRPALAMDCVLAGAQWGSCSSAELNR